MFKIQNESELRQCFRDSERNEVLLNEALHFPVFVKDYLTWLEPSGVRAYLVFKGESFKAPLGMIFRRDQTMGPSVAAMCEWCHSVRSGNEIGILTVQTQKRKRLGISLCRDLSCAEKIRSTPGASDFNSTLSTQERLSRLAQKMTLFAQRELI